MPAQNGNGRGFAASRWRRGGVVRFCLLISLSMLFLVEVAASQASMYVCRDKSGAMNFTNAPVVTNCQVFAMESTGRIKAMVGEAAISIDSAGYDQDIRRIGRRYQIDPPLIKAIIHTESDFDHRAVSKRGAQGLMQLMPETARDLRVGNPFNPRENIDGGTRYLRWLLDSFNGDLILSLAAYNAGPGLVTRTGGVPRIAETRQYVNKVLKRYKAYKNEHSKTDFLVKE
jgi:soluble lytic murein transglycosylase-like protein